MKFTNKMNLPQYLVDWLKNDEYDYNPDPNTTSATGLMKPLRVSVLTSRHGANLEIDVADLVASRYGNAIHDSIERVNTPGTSKEVRTAKKITVKGVEFTVTGKYDLLIDNGNGTHTLRDIKTTSVWAYIYGGKDKDYQLQLSIYKWLLSDEKTIGDMAYIDFFFTDWQSSKARTEDKYPNNRIAPGYKIKLLSSEEVEKFIVSKLEQIVDFRDVPDDDLPFCTKEELWAEDDTFAVYKIGNKRATKVCDSKEEADQYQLANKISGHIQHRPGKVKRCKYCSAAPFCNQFTQLMEAGLIQD